jgi:hypothetical protein
LQLTKELDRVRSFRGYNSAGLIGEPSGEKQALSIADVAAFP